jgi:hypothetical protein
MGQKSRDDLAFDPITDAFPGDPVVGGGGCDACFG